MTVYVLHRQTLRTDTVFPMEAFPSQERATCALQVRARTQKSTAWPLSDGAARADDRWPLQQHPFPEADITGFMLVWLRPAAAPPPQPTDTPDEVWRLSDRGAVRREAWEEGAPVAVFGETPHAALTAAQRRTKALDWAAGLPPVRAEFTEVMNPLYLRTLRDLVQDPQTEDALLRMMQAARHQP